MVWSFLLPPSSLHTNHLRVLLHMHSSPLLHSCLAAPSPTPLIRLIFVQMCCHLRTVQTVALTVNLAAIIFNMLKLKRQKYFLGLLGLTLATKYK